MSEAETDFAFMIPEDTLRGFLQYVIVRAREEDTPADDIIQDVMFFALSTGKYLGLFGGQQ